MNSHEREIYAAVLREGGFSDLSKRGKIEVTGPDRSSFLHSMISQDVEGVKTGMGNYSTFLTATGKMIADFYFYKLPDRILIDVEGDLAGKLQQALERFVIMDDVSFEAWRPPTAHFAVHGPSSIGIVQQICSQPPPSRPLELVEILLPARGWMLSKSSLLQQGVEIILPGQTPGNLAQELRARGLPEIPRAVQETLRIEAMIPRFGADMSEDNNPLEARLEQAYSLEKGCYVGQEVVAKATHVGGVNRLLVGLVLPAGSVVPKPGTRLRHEGKGVGVITSSCQSPRLGSPIALGYLRRSLARDRQEVEVEAEPAALSARAFLEFPRQSPA